MVTEGQILLYQANPADDFPEIVDAIQNGDIMLVSKERQQLIMDRITELFEDNKLLVNSISKLLKSCEGIAENAPEALELAAQLNLVNKKGEFQMSSIVGLAGDFMTGSKKAQRIKDTFAKLSAGFDKETFLTIPLSDLLQSLKNKGIKFDTYSQVAELIAAKNQQPS